MIINTYYVYVFLGSLMGSLILRKLLYIAISQLELTHTIHHKTASYLKTYILIKAIVTPLLFTGITMHQNLHLNGHLKGHPLLLNFNGATALLSPERQILSLIIHKGTLVGW